MGTLTSAMVQLNKEGVLRIVNEYLEKDTDPLKILEELQLGMKLVGEKFERQEYFLFDLIWSGEIFKEVAKILEPKIQEKHKNIKKKGKMMIGTVKGDVHDIGKNIVITLLESAGIDVVDLGVDVPAEEFVRKAKEIEPDVIGMSGLLTASIDAMHKTIELLRGEEINAKVIVGGGIVGEKWVSGELQVDAIAVSAPEGVKMIEKLMEGDAI